MTIKENPWLGLKSYEENDHLFGREKESDELSNIVINSFHTIIYGKSGIGKTSLLRAGVFPTLRYEDFLPIYIRLEHKENAESDYYLRQIEEIIDNSTDGLTVGTAKDKCDTLSDVFSKYSFGKSRGIALMPVFVFDQFEEIFTLNENRESEAVSRFFADLSDILNNDNNNLNFRIVFCLREDYLYYIERLSESIPAFKRNRYCLQDLTNDEALEVITQPCEGMVDDAVAQEILHKLSPEKTNEVNATILSLYMSQLFDKMVKSDGKTISSSLVRQFGDDIISAFYFDSIEGVSEKTIEYLEDHLVTTGGYRHNVPLEDAIADGVKQSEINHLKNLRILNIQPHQGNILYMEYAHDVLCPIVVSNRDKRTLRKKAKRQKKIIAAWILSILFMAGITTSFILQNRQISKRQEAMMLMQSRAIAGQAEQLLEMGEYAKGIALCLRALPKNLSNPDRPVSYEAIKTLYSYQYSDFANCKLVLNHKNEVRIAQFSPDERYIAVSTDSIVWLWDAETGKLVRTFNRHNESFNYSTFSPDGRYIVSYSYGNPTILWETATGNEVHIFKGKEKPEGSVSYSPDGRYLVSSVDTAVIIWNAVTGKAIRKIEIRKSEISDGYHIEKPSFSPDGKYIITVYNAFNNDFYEGIGAIVWSVATGKQVRLFKKERLDPVIFASFSPDGRKVSVNTDYGHVYVWDFNTGVLLKTMEGHGENVAIHSYSPDSKYIAMGKDSTVKIWNVESGEEVRTIKGHGDIVMSAFFSRDGKSLLTSSRDGNVMLWNLEDTKQNQSLTNYSMGFSQNSFSPDKKHIALYSTSEKAVMEYDIQTGKPVRKLFSVDIQTTASYSQDGKFIVTSPSLVQAEYVPDTMARVWNANGELISTLQGHNSTITSSSFSPDGKYVVTSSYDTTACVWSITGKLIHKLKGHKDGVTSASFSPDGRYIATSSMDNTAIIWDAKTGCQMQVLKGHTEPLVSAVFSPNGRYIATSSEDNDLIIWDAVSGKKNKILRNQGGMSSVAFSPDSRYVVATFPMNNNVVVFDVESGEQIIELKCMTPISAAFTPDGKQIAAFSIYPMMSRMGKYSYIRFWRFYQPQELIDRFRSVVGNYSFTPYEEIKYYLK